MAWCEKNGQPPSKTPVCWGNKQQAAVEELVEHHSSPPIIAYPFFSKEFALHTDASKEDLGTVFYKKQNGVMRVALSLSPA